MTSPATPNAGLASEQAVPFRDANRRGVGIRRRWWLGFGFAVIVGLGAALKGIAEWGQLRTAVGRELQTNAELKTRQIADWREERLGEARFLSLAPGVASDVAALLAAPDSTLARQRVANWLNAIKGGERYESALLLDLTLAVRAAVPEDAEPPGPPLREEAQRVLAEGRIRLSDLHRATPEGPLHLEVLAPIFAPPEEMPRGTPIVASPGERPIAVAVLRIRPEQKLFPLTVTWPTPSETAEAVLVRLETGGVVQLSETRRRPGTALRRSHPAAVTPFAPGPSDEARRQPAVWVDYRGEPVLSVMRPVPDTPWHLISKIDLREAYAPLHRAAWQTAGGAGLLICAILLAVGYTGSRQDRRLLRQALHTARESALASERQALLSNEANDVILLVDSQGAVVEANPRALATYGYTLPEMKGLTVVEIRSAELRSRARDDMRRVSEEGNAVYETVHVRKDGSCFPVEVSSRVVQVDGRPHFLSVVRDISERRRAEEAQRERARLEDQFAKVAASVPGMVYSFRLGPDGRMTLPYCNDHVHELWGFGPEELRSDFRPALMRVHPADLEATRENISRSARDLTWWYGRFRVTHPIRGERWLEGQSVPQREPDGGTLWHGYIQDVTEREKGRRALVESEERLRLFVEHAPAALAMLDREMRYLTASRRWRLDYGLGERRIEGESHYTIFPEIGEAWKSVHRRGLAGEVITNEDDRFDRADGTVQWLRWEVRPWRDGFGAIGGIMIFSEDITARKEAEQAMAAQVVELQRWHALTHGREARVLELKAEVNRLQVAAGQPPRYAAVESTTDGAGIPP